jgi:hypothetical protein
MNEPFYIGYLPAAPAGLRRWLRIVVVALFALAVALSFVLAFGFQRLPLSVFEYGQAREYVGLMRARPYPSLLVVNGNQIEQYLLVGSGKHSADVDAFAGQSVRLRGSLIIRDRLRMLEIIPGSIINEIPSKPRDNPAKAMPLSDESSITTSLLTTEVGNREKEASLSDERLGQFTLRGEIVDSKCYLGVMNPGHKKPHRECAVRCISGGVPPLFLARDTHGQEIVLQLADAAGEPLSQAILDFVAEPIEITGQVWRTGKWLTLRAAPQTYQRR